MKLFRPTPLSGSVSTGLLLLRIVAGLAFMFHGWGKIQNPTGWMGPNATIPGVLQALAAISGIWRWTCLDTRRPHAAGVVRPCMHDGVRRLHACVRVERPVCGPGPRQRRLRVGVPFTFALRSCCYWPAPGVSRSITCCFAARLPPRLRRLQAAEAHKDNCKMSCVGGLIRRCNEAHGAEGLENLARTRRARISRMRG
jgi:hypothetical protein